MKKKSLLIMVFLMLLTACTGNESSVSKNTDNLSIIETDIIETEETPTIPDDLTLNGQDFNLLTSYYNDYCKITKEEISGEVLNDAIYNMEVCTEERLDVNIIEDQYECQAAIELADALVASGDSTYDAMNQLDRFAIDAMLKGYLRPLEDAEYMDLTAPWWHPDVTKEMAVGNNTYYAVSASNTLMYADTSAVYVNITLADTLGIDIEDIYDSVRQGLWTQDQMMQYATHAKADLSGDGIMGQGDQWGLMCYDEFIFGSSLVAASGTNSLGKDDNNNFILQWNTEQYINRLENAFNLFHNDTVACAGNAGTVRHKATEFIQGNVLFMHGFFMAVDQLSEMENDYTIIPTPKYEVSQDSYICVNYDLMTYIMPKFVNDPKVFGAVLEWLSYEGKRIVEDAYIETTMKYKAARDEYMAEMVQMCLDASMIDLGSMYCYDFCGYGTMHRNVTSINSFNFASYAAAQDKAIQTRLTEIADAVANVQ